jgi:hypothetical protein
MLQITGFTYIKVEYPYLRQFTLCIHGTARRKMGQDQQTRDKVDPARTEQNSKNINNNSNMS